MWELVSSATAFETPWLQVLKKSYRTPHGLEDFFTIERRDFVLVVARREAKLVLVKQFRPGTGQSYWALPAGYIDEGESPVQTAERELREETGLIGQNFRRVGELHPLPGYIRSIAHVITCDVADGRISAGPEVEDARLLRMEEVLGLVGTGDIKEMQAVAAVLLAHNVWGSDQGQV